MRLNALRFVCGLLGGHVVWFFPPAPPWQLYPWFLLMNGITVGVLTFWLRDRR